jgi:hypothetical protein
MQIPTSEPARHLQELHQIREHVRRSVQALEICWSCQRICECNAEILDDGPPVWICPACLTAINTQREKASVGVLWPCDR